MNMFDALIIAFLNESSHRLLIIDKFMMSIVDYQLLRGGVIFAVIWGLWFKYADERNQRLKREHIVATLLACFLSMYFARILALALPFRVRPMYNPDLHFIVPSGWITTHFTNFSSFPSDNAAIFFALATGIFLVSKSIGMIISLYVFFIICTPRIYLGLHYPTDILAGMLLGIAVCLIMNMKKIRIYVTKPIMYMANTTPGLYYACFFLLTFEMGNFFWNVRTFLVSAYKVFFFF